VRRTLALVGLAVAVGLLVPGLTLPVITIDGVLQPAGIAALAPQLLEQGVTDQSVAALRPLLNPTVANMLDSSPGGLRGAIVNRIGTQLAKQLESGTEIEVYHQTRSILGSVRHLYDVGGNTAATLILVFSVLVPFLKVLLVLWAVYRRDPLRRDRTLGFVETIAKWSMADVFAVALFIAYLAAQATQAAGGSAAALVTFRATLGPGFYWFAAYCLFSLATQQATARWFRTASP
jgi:paraquat-inducible protein A